MCIDKTKNEFIIVLVLVVDVVLTWSFEMGQKLKNIFAILKTTWTIKQFSV